MSYSVYVPQHLQDSFVLQSPNFEIMTYASTTQAPANRSIRSLGSEDYLLFYATLDFKGNPEKRQKWINAKWGAYLVGLFKIQSIWESIYHVLEDDTAVETFADYDWFRVLTTKPFPDDWAPWIKGVDSGFGCARAC